MTYSWRFNRMHPSVKAREPIQGEFFATDAISNPGEALVREGIQNTLDARRNGEKVMVRIRVSGTGAAVARNSVDPFLNGLDDHLKAPENGLREIPNDGDKCPVLVFEDFGTTGLLGDPVEWKPASGSHNHFYYFFRAEGRSDKGEKDIGRWGVGKQVFPRASRINSIFGLTVRNDDKKKLLMGMAVLKSHDLNGTRYAPDGWLGLSENGDDGLILPIEDSAFIDAFSKAFDVQRGDEPGLTVVVPWCDLDLTDENLVRAVLRDYFWPILRGQLEVIVETGSIQTILDASSLENEIKKIGNELEREILPLVELAKWASRLTDPDYVQLTSPDANRSWQWSKELFPEDSLSDLRNRYERGEKIAIRVPVSVRKKNHPPRGSSFDIFLYRDGSEQSGRPVFIREGIIIPDVRAPRTRGVRSLVNAEDGPIAAFLGDSENPAHTQWQKDGANFRGKYVSGASDLPFVIRSVHEIVNILCDQDKKEDRRLLADLFSIPAPPEDRESRMRDKKKPDKPGPNPDKPTPPHPRLRPFNIDRIKGGFVVRNGDTNGLPPPKALYIRAAYQVRRGNSFKKYHTDDFDFSQHMNTQLTGATALEKKRNSLRVEIDSNDFRVEMTGFDPKRDVRVEVRREEDDNASSDA
jgi:hypothetical protein